MNQVSAKTMGLVAITYPSETMFSYELKSNYYFGIPVSVSPSGLAMDADRLITLVKSLDGETDKPKQFLLSSGMNGSALEHSVPEQLFSTPDNPAQGISAVKALQIANDQGMPIYTINQSNINTIIPQLQIDTNAKTDIRNAVNAGKEVTVSKTNVTFNGWTGVGYIILDPKTGAGAYMISGGMNGAIIFIALATIFLMYALLPVMITGGSITIFGMVFAGGGTVINAVIASVLITFEQLFFVLMISKGFREWLGTNCKNISQFSSQIIKTTIGQNNPLTLLVTLLGQLCDV